MKVFEVLDAPLWGTSYAEYAGGIAVPGKSHFQHVFGGSDWFVGDPRPICRGPSILLTLDLSDPLLLSLKQSHLTSLPLCTYVGRDVWVSPQSYRLTPSRQFAEYIDRAPPATDADLEDVQNSLAPMPLSIFAMNSTDIPVSEDAYWLACDEFVGGSRFLRVLGPPLWLQTVNRLKCNCGNEMRYVASLGYEVSPPFSGLIRGLPVFLGEAALYWFLCEQCLIVGVVSQPT